MEEYVLKFKSMKDLVIMDEPHISIIVSILRENKSKKIQLEMNQIITKMYLSYLVKIINANRHIEGFEYSYITKENVRQEEIGKIMSYQLKRLMINNRPCFRNIKCILNRQGKRQLIMKSTYFFRKACEYKNSKLIYKSSKGKKIL